MLSNSIALIIGASYLGVEAFRTKHLVGRIVLGVLCVAFLFSAMFLEAITESYPKMGAFISGAFDDPSAWVALLVGLFFVLRPLWSRSVVSTQESGNLPDHIGGDVIENQKLIEQNARIEEVEVKQKALAVEFDSMLELVVKFDETLETLEAKIAELEQTVSRREAIHADTERREKRQANFKAANERLLGLQEGRRQIEELWKIYSDDPHRKGHGAVSSAITQFFYDCERLKGLPPSPLPQELKIDPSDHVDFRNVSQRMNDMNSGDAKEFEQAYTHYQRLLAAIRREEESTQQTLRENHG